MILIQRGKNYVVYDKDGKVVIITVDRHIAVNYARQKNDRVRQGRSKQ